jgi:hypothetical protein
MRQLRLSAPRDSVLLPGMAEDYGDGATRALLGVLTPLYLLSGSTVGQEVVPAILCHGWDHRERALSLCQAFCKPP